MCSPIKLLDYGYAWDTNGDKSRLDWILNPVIRSAAEVLVSDDLQNIKSCADPACGWLFLDVSRNKRRRWCDIQDCGNRAKASHFYRKKQGRNMLFLKWFLEASCVVMHIIPNPPHACHIVFPQGAKFQGRQGGTHLVQIFRTAHTNIYCWIG